jgi:hypothetical protein
VISLAVAATAAAVLAASAFGAKPRPTLSFVVQNRGIAFVTASGSTPVFPGNLQVGDRILARDAVFQGSRSVGYDNELCTVTVDNHFLCQDMLVLPGRGEMQVSWLWIHWPSNYTGVIDGGTGAFAHASGQFTATVLRSGALRITATLK